jgi:hypothetical protein
VLRCCPIYYLLISCDLSARIQDVLDVGKARAAGHANALEQDRANLDIPKIFQFARRQM